ncbi:uncharacterized protein LOC121933463 [Sceloporus undulatus]|uniref:uncharacterized protein LOC121933463 n=1 Tax=Sceloporus undulatus TaxID=8520 RepID=UPI001C4CC5A0|nr:uncharacterized protein LOC121933463 [Sceloporus undulatus]XP_042329171.1 uncharacterized protein LOC121933463 [Sceloporus undulatus]
MVLHKAVLIRTENITAKSHVNCQGGTTSRSLMKEAQTLLTWAESNLLSLEAKHLQGQLNTKADWLSRTDIDQGEWSLHPKVYQSVIETLGHPVLDLFASPSNVKTPRFFSRFKTQGAENFNALNCRWPEGLLYAFPPVPLLSRLLSKIWRTRSEVILIAPAWLRRPWFSEILNLSIQSFPLQTRPTLSGTGPSPRPHLDSASRLEIERSMLTRYGYSSEVIESILASRRPSTIKIYEYTFKAFKRWCKRKKKDFIEVTVATLKRQVAVITSILPHNQAAQISHHSHIRRLLKGVSNRAPPTKH